MKQLQGSISKYKTTHGQAKEKQGNNFGQQNIQQSQSQSQYLMCTESAQKIGNI